MREFELMTLGERNEAYVAQKAQVIERHLNPFFGETEIAEVSSGLIQAYRMMRLEGADAGRAEPGEDLHPARPKTGAQARARLEAPDPEHSAQGNRMPAPAC